MGLMTSPKAQKAISSLILRLYKPLSVFLYLGAFVAMGIVSSNLFSARTYISENALLPGLVDRQYKSISDIAGYAKRLQELSGAGGGIPATWLHETLQSVGLDTYSQNFSAVHPFLVSGEEIEGTNIFAILRAPRTAGTEAVIFSIPYREKEAADEFGSTDYGIAMMISLAKHFIQQSYWSKDIIFLIVDKENVGAQAWLEAYHEVQSDYISKGSLHGRSGPIIAAINLELAGKRVDHIDLRIEGLNGQLPNLDLFNMIVKLCGKEGIEPRFHGQASISYEDQRHFYGVHYTSKTILSNMLRQASGKPHGIHGLFLRYGIPAMTLHGIPSHSIRGDQTHSVGYVLEGIFRSINNLLERFHQSFFFYVLPETKKYVSIGLYMIPMGMLLFVPTLQGLALWFLTGSKDGQGKGDIDPKLATEDPVSRDHHYVVPIFIGVHVCGLLLFLSPELLVVNFSSYFGLHPADALMVGLAAVFLGIVTLLITGKKHEPEADLNFRENRWKLLKCYSLVWQSISLLALSMMNFSLAFLVAIFTIPIYAICKPYQNLIGALLYKLLLFIVSPPFILLLLMVAHNIVFHKAPLSLDLLYDAGQSMLGSVPGAVVDQYLFNNWTFAVASLVLFPSWQMFWFCSSL